MVPFLLIASLVASVTPANLGDVEPWFNSLTDQEIWESLERTDPNHPASIRLLDLTLARFRSREQSFLFMKWAEYFENLRPGTALSLHALAWQAWMKPEHLRDSDDLEQIERRLESENHSKVWDEIIASFPNDISGVLAARLLVSRSNTIPEGVRGIRSASPESGVAALLALVEGDEFAKTQDWENAVNSWLEGILHYPLDWEIEEWVTRIKNGILHSGHGVQARIAQDFSKENLQRLRRYREALSMARKGDEEAAKEELINLIDDPKSGAELKSLCHAHWILLGGSDKGTPSDRELIWALANAPDSDIQSHLEKLESSTSSNSLPNDILSIASYRFDQGDIRGANALWGYLVDEFPAESMIAAEAYHHLVDVSWARLEAIRGIRSSFSNEEFDAFFAQSEAAQEDKARRELENVLERSEIFAASGTYSDSLLNLMTSLYKVYANLGRPNRPRTLFLLHAKQVSADSRLALVRQAQLFRPDEAIAILGIDSGSTETSLPSDQNQVLLNLYEEEGRYQEAATVARAIAQEASGTVHEQEAWYKTAWLEYKAADYRSSKSTLEDLLPQQEPGTVQHTETNRLLGLANYQIGDYEGARTHFDAALESGLLEKGKQEELALLYAYSHMYRQEYSFARARLESILADNPSRIMARRVNQIIQQLNSPN